LRPRRRQRRTPDRSETSGTHTGCYVRNGGSKENGGEGEGEAVEGNGGHLDNRSWRGRERCSRKSVKIIKSRLGKSSKKKHPPRKPRRKKNTRQTLRKDSGWPSIHLTTGTIENGRPTFLTSLSSRQRARKKRGCPA